MRGLASVRAAIAFLALAKELRLSLLKESAMGSAIAREERIRLYLKLAGILGALGLKIEDLRGLMDAGDRPTRP